MKDLRDFHMSLRDYRERGDLGQGCFGRV